MGFGTSVKPSYLLPVCVSIALPGCGHIAAGRPAKGLLLFFLFGFAVDGFIYSHVQGLVPPERASANAATLVYWAALAGGILLWAFAVADTAAIALRRHRVEAMSDVATAHVREALIAYLRADYRSAVQALRAALHIDDHDPDALFYLGVVYASLGDRRKARRSLRRCIRHGRDGKWDTEARSHLKALEAPPQKAPAPPPAPTKGEDIETHP
jgi:tetratricopeptide (TPR) repeat protein